MSKKRKTRREKERSAARTQLSISQESSMPVYSFQDVPKVEVAPISKPAKLELNRSSLDRKVTSSALDRKVTSSALDRKVTSSALDRKVASSAYSYVISDIRQTIIITSALLVSSVVLYFLIQNQILRLTMFGY